jgi:morphogenetic protein associated with SpoVID
MPKADHPYGNQSTKSYPVTEIDNQVAPAKEMPKKEMPKKEQPKKEMPVKEQPKKEMPKKEAPIALPKLPKLQPMTPEVDINNYYTLNMQIPPKKEKPKEEPKKEESPELEVESIEMAPPIMPQQPCYPMTPVTPVMPGCGYHYMPCYPCPPMWHAPPMMMPQQAPMMPMAQPEFEGMMESPGEMGQVMGMQEGYMPMMQQPMTLGWPPGCVPYGPTQCSPCPPPFMGYQPAPMYMPHMQPQVQGAMMNEESDEYMQMGQQPMFNPYQPMPQQQGDCGCGDSGYGSMPGYQQMPYRFPAYGVPTHPAPYGVVPPFSPYGVPANNEQNLFGMPNYEDDED